MRHVILCTVAALSLAAGTALAQNQPKEPEGAAGKTPAGGEMKLPPGGQKGAPASNTTAPGKGIGTPAVQGKPAASGGSMKKEPGKGQQNGASSEQSADQPAKPDEQQKNSGSMKDTASGQEKPGTQKQPGQGKPARTPPRLNAEQQTRVKTVFQRVNVEPVRVNFTVNVGVAVPRTVSLRPVPPEVITVVPEYEGFQFFVVPGQIIIVDPDSLEIVAILPL